MWVWEGFYLEDPCELTFANTLLLSNAAISLGNAFINLEISSEYIIFFTLWSFFLSSLFISLQIKEFRILALSINDSLYSSLFFFLTGLHFFHLSIGLILLIYFWSSPPSRLRSRRVAYARPPALGPTWRETGWRGPVLRPEAEPDGGGDDDERSRSGRRPVRSPLRSLHLGPLAPLASVNHPPHPLTSLIVGLLSSAPYVTLGMSPPGERREWEEGVESDKKRPTTVRHRLACFLPSNLLSLLVSSSWSFFPFGS